MAPKGGRSKPKGEKKKKEEKIPVVLDITVNLPNDSQVTLKGISTDRIMDVRRLLAVNTETCSITNYSLSHEVRGHRLKDSVDVSALKPPVLALVEEDYDENSAVAHVRRLLDIVACTTCFGPSSSATNAARSKADPKKEPSSPPKDGAAANGTGGGGGGTAEKRTITTAATTTTKDGGGSGVTTTNVNSSSTDSPSAGGKDVTEGEGEMSGALPRLAQFYEFFSLSHLTPPLQFIRRSTRQSGDETRSDGDLFSLEVKLCNGKLFVVEACTKGFYRDGKQRILCHNLVDLLRQLSRAFDNAYDDLMKAFTERNKFGNLPYGFRANTWLVPTVASQSPSDFPPLPTEDETWGGNGGGLGRDGKFDTIPWADEFSFLASMPCKTAEERQVRDRKAFLLHSLFVDVAIFKAVSCVRSVMERSDSASADGTTEILHTERVGDLCMTVLKDAPDASCKVDTRIDGSKSIGMDPKKVAERNLLKGITADENTAAHDIATLGVISVRYCGYIAVVKVDSGRKDKVLSSVQSCEIGDQPEGGSNALNINSLRALLHKKPLQPNSKLTPHLHNLEIEELHSAQIFVKRILEESLNKLQLEEQDRGSFIRWELGACWIQHLQDQITAEKEKKKSNEKAKTEKTIEGLGKPLRLVRSIKKKTDVSTSRLQLDDEKHNTVTGESENSKPIDHESVSRALENEAALKLLLTDSAFTRLKESETGLHCKVKLSDKLSHVQSLCVHEMIVRAFKHILRAVIAAAAPSREELAALIAVTLNILLGVPEVKESHGSCNVNALVWRWLELFLMKRYKWELTSNSYRDIRKFAILRGLCHKVGVELAPRDYDMEGPNPFRKSDVISLIPVHKQVACSSADGRTLLESSKTALDKGKLEDAVNHGTKVFICSYIISRATIYQQKALDINERELGLDHPDTMKSYGDLAVFYYRLQHTELALKYVKRALYLLHLTCGPSHPNTAATYINVAMMEEGLGNVHVALRYLHKALKCNQKLLGPDHIQTAASYHAIAIALSLMEAYPLSVQHEQTTLQILRAKLGPDDLRTQDAAAWLEYFESKAFEQQEAARNGTRKPDASIASKGHLSVSDLLDYINPNHDLKGRDAEGGKRRGIGTKAKVKSNQNYGRASSEESSKDSTDAPEEDTRASDTDVGESKDLGSTMQVQSNPHAEKIVTEMHGVSGNAPSTVDMEGEDGWQAVQRPRSTILTGQKSRQRRTNVGKVYVYQKKEASGTETLQQRSRNSYPNGHYYLLKKRTATSGGNMENQPTKSTAPANRFSRKIVKSVTYRVKSVPSSTNADPPSGTRISSEASNPGSGTQLASDGQKMAKGDQTVAVPQNIAVGTSSLTATLGKTPSYKDVALAPPGTIVRMHGRHLNDQNTDNPDSVGESETRESFVSEKSGQNTEVLTENETENLMQVSSETSAITELNDDIENEKGKDNDVNSLISKRDNLVLENHEQSQQYVGASEPLGVNICSTQEESKLKAGTVENLSTLASSGLEAAESCNILVYDRLNANDPEGKIAPSNNMDIAEGQLTASKETDSVPGAFELPEVGSEKKDIVGEAESFSIPSPMGGENLEKGNLATGEGETDIRASAPETKDTSEVHSKKLSASAAPFNPSPSVVHGGMPMNINPHPGASAMPAVAPWPVSLPLHPSPTAVPAMTPICTSPNHPYASPRSPHVLHPLPFMYPPYPQLQPLPSRAYALNSNYFQANNPWQCNMNPNAIEFVPGIVWPGCPPDISLYPPANDPAAKPTVEEMNRIPPHDLKLAASIPPMEAKVGGEAKSMDMPVELASSTITLSDDAAGEKTKDESPGSSRIQAGEFEQECSKSPGEKSVTQGEQLQSSSENRSARNSRKSEDDGSINILIKGRRTKRQNLRLPMSLLNRPYGSQSFKVIYNRVVRGSEAPKSTNVSSTRDGLSSQAPEIKSSAA
ncbi:TSS protein [Nymphaea thermarum]|nr:TSS protein [Nymphaea thermarum]